MPPQSEFAKAYKEALQDLTSPDMAKIKLLRELAQENKAEAANVVEVMRIHAQTCKDSMRLPAIYLMDCVLKTAGQPYPDLLARALPQVFSFVWDRASLDLRSKLVRTAGTWNEHLPANVIATITQKMQPVPQQQSLLQAPVPPELGPVPHVMVVQQPAMQQQVVYSATGQPLVVTSLPAAVALPQTVAWPAGNVLLPSPPAAAVRPAADISALLHQLRHQVEAQQQQVVVTPQPGSGSGWGSKPPQDATQGLVEVLVSGSDHTRAKFLDLQFLRNRRLQSATHLVRPWFVKVDAWLVGTRAVEQEAGAFFDEEQEKEAQGAGKGAEPMLVEEDLSQPCCAISSEAFERTYDPDTDKWYYEDAVVLTGEQAATYGVMEGSIVKASSLAGQAPPVALQQGAGGGARGGAAVTRGAGEPAPSLAAAGAVDGTVSAAPLQPQQRQAQQQTAAVLSQKRGTPEAQHAAAGGAALPDQKRARLEGVAS